jgi:hypothetical protein
MNIDIRTVDCSFSASNKEKRRPFKEYILHELRKGILVNELARRYGTDSKDDYMYLKQP